MSLRWSLGQGSNSESLGTEHTDSAGAMQWVQNGVRRQALEPAEDWLSLHATDWNLWTHLNGQGQPAGNCGFVDTPLPFACFWYYDFLSPLFSTVVHKVEWVHQKESTKQFVGHEEKSVEKVYF